MSTSFDVSQLSQNTSVASTNLSIQRSELTRKSPSSSPAPSIVLSRRPSTIIIKEYCSPWTIEYLVRLWLFGKTTKNKYEFQIENFRAIFYWFFLLNVLLGMFLTKVFAKAGSAVILTDVFRASNICTNFDFSPATYFLPFVWIFPMFIVVTYHLFVG